MFGWLLVRAALLPRRTVSIARVGMLEVLHSALLLLAVWQDFTALG